MSDPFLSEDDLIVLSLAADGERMIAIGRWEKPTEKLEALGYLEYAPDKFNAVITAAGRERWTAEEAAELHAIVRMNNMVVEEKKGKEPADAPGDAKRLQ